ncbi:bifunctional metallophosphatase/5'-nucleotidase [Nonomuraea cavernae]|uniref:Bifunctional metallophosphatase/5'-nucleotidase n=1 Tax=Nonomuraea cavernae TaxID=2045107 RepID=A0A917YYX9_9ACTN|nr:bifunctional metallophosphatase/5'-nucleotidase [Nonomuraea cavernae]MCA2187361.1 bifunctional metallophosphatase/5'-nucleotidase [Nonomuraea cavernae]GGO68379.1 bifunctional metallophosphatase/5'-nucleotidase [Nonomuraea cavernae]
MTSRSLLRLALAGAVATGSVLLAAVPADAGKAPRTVPIRLLALNDFHGNLEPPGGSSGRMVDESGATVDAGGAAFVATHMKAHADQNTIAVAQGDLIGATPLVSAAYHDEPSVEFMGKIGLKVAAVGNHEFDEGYAELRRIMKGGCHPVDGCSPAGQWKGAAFDYVGANVLFKNPNEKTDALAALGAQGQVKKLMADWGVPALPPVSVKWMNGVPIGFIGLVTQTTPNIVTAEGIKDLKFVDEVKAANVASKLLKLLGVKAQVVLVHEGDQVTAGQSPDACSAVPGAGNRIATQVDPEIDLVLSGHSHQAYLCTVKDPAGRNRLYSQGGSFGRVITQVDLQVNVKTRDVDRSTVVADNHVVTRTVTPDPEISAFVQTWKDRVAPVANKPVGTISADLTNTAAPSGESPLGNLIADGQLAATRTGGNAQIALMNPGGVRNSLNYAGSPAGEGDGVVTYGEAFAVQPFNNLMQVVTLTGAQLKTVLEQQFTGGPNNQAFTKILQPSANLTYTYSRSAAWGAKVSDITIDGTPVTDTQSIRVAVNNFLVGGGDAFLAFTEGTDVWSGPLDIDAFVEHLGRNNPIAPPATNRITVVD